jgi:membrane protein implicated in regulation of membrane protease activity
MSWLRGIPAAFGRMRARLGKAWASIGNAYRAVKGMTRQDWLAVGFACLSFAILGAIGWMFWGVAGHISAHLPHWFFGHDSFDWFLSMIPWAFAISFLSAAVKRTRRRSTSDTKSKK